MKKIVIAGANSFVASHFVHELLSQGFHVVALVRKSLEQTATERMNRALMDTTLGFPENIDQLTVLDYALLEDGFGIPHKELEWVFSDTVDYFHFAASLKFDFQSRDEIFETNIDGIGNALKVFEQYSSPDHRFFFISTAYSCGDFQGTFEEKFYPVEDISSFRNYYEQSKRMAENVLREYVENKGVQGHVIRLAQVVGNSESGVTRTDYGIFDFARRIHTLAHQFPGQTVRILADPHANQNLIPIDTAVHDLIVLTKSGSVPIILNFVANTPVENYKIIQIISDLLPIELIPQKDIDLDDMNAMEKLVLEGMTFTGHYTDINIDFDTRARDTFISSNHREVPESSLHDMVAYFLDHIQVRDTIKTKS